MKIIAIIFGAGTLLVLLWAARNYRRRDPLSPVPARTRPITTDEEHEDLLWVASGLMEKEQLTPDETALLNRLSGLISDYEKRRYPLERFNEGTSQNES